MTILIGSASRSRPTFRSKYGKPSSWNLKKNRPTGYSDAHWRKVRKEWKLRKSLMKLTVIEGGYGI